MEHHPVTLRKYSTENQSELHELIAAFDRQTKEHTITSTVLRPWDLQQKVNKMYDNQYILSVTSENRIHALMAYQEYEMESIDDVLNFFAFHLYDIQDTTNNEPTEKELISNPLLQTLPDSTTMAYVEYLESFERYKGYGTVALNHLKCSSQIGHILLMSLTYDDAGPTPFYKKQHFEETDLYIKKSPLMVWSKR